MNRIAVHILVDNGPPARIQYVEDSALPRASIIVDNDYDQVLPAASDSYGRFVAADGPVGQTRAPSESGNFILSVSKAFDNGNSWELAVFIAHALARVGRLAQCNRRGKLGQPLLDDDRVDKAIYLTGRIKSLPCVEDVEKVTEKLKWAHPDIEAWRARRIPIQIFLPRNEETCLHEWAGDVRRIDRVDAVLELIVPAPRRIDDVDAVPESIVPAPRRDDDVDAVPESIVPAPPRRRRALPAALVVLVLVLAGMGFWQRESMAGWLPLLAAWLDRDRTEERAGTPEGSDPQAPPPRAEVDITVAAMPAPLRLLLRERRAPRGATCMEVLFGGGSPVLRDTPAPEEGVVGAGMLDGLCGLELVIEPAEPLLVWVVRRGDRLLPERWPQDRPTLVSAPVRWRLDVALEDRGTRELEIRAMRPGGAVAPGADPSASKDPLREGAALWNWRYRFGN